MTERSSGWNWLNRPQPGVHPHSPELGALLDALPISVFAYMPDRGVVYANRTLAERMGRPAEQLIGLQPPDFFPPHVSEQILIQQQRALAGEAVALEVPFTLPHRPEGGIGLMNVAACDAPGAGRVITVAVRDITREREVEVDLARQRDFIQALFDTTDALLIVIGQDGAVVRWNRACERLTGFHISEVAGRKFTAALVSAGARGAGEALLADALANERVERGNLPLVARDGRTIHVAWSASSLAADDPAQRFTLLTGVDETSAITARRHQAESALEFEAVWESVADAMMFLDSSGSIAASNSALRRMAGLPGNHVDGRVFLDILRQWPGHEQDELAQFRARYDARCFPEREVAEYHLNSGRVAWFEMASSLVDRPGQPTLVLQIARDITEQVKREQQLRETNEFLESATQWAKEMAASAELASAAKSEFLANVSHEIRTPMNGILGMTELALMTGLTEEQREYLTMVESSAESLLTLLDDILDLSKAEAGRIEFRPAPFDLAAEIESLMKPITHRAAAKNLSAHVTFSPNLPRTVVGDWSRLRQVLLNLLANAVKFTDAGEVRLSVECLGYENRDARIRFIISDSGIGIPPHRVQDAFAPFTQLDGSNTRRRGGTGLGLSICSKLVDLMGGRVFVRATGGPGADIGFVLPLPVAADDVLPRPTNHLVPKRFDRPVHCLLAEDNPVNQRLFLAMFDRAGIRATLARNGVEAVKLAREQTFDFAIMDVQMPEMDGLEAAGAIRRSERGSTRHLPIIAITAHAMPGDRDLCFTAGMDSYLSKPVRMEVLLDEIHNLLSQIPVSGTMGMSAQPSDKRMSTIDYAQALDRVGGDRELLGELAMLFLDEHPRLLGECGAGIDSGDLAAVSAAAHQLKGLLAQFGSEQGRQSATALESAAKAGDEAACRPAFEALSLFLDGLRPVFTRLAAGEEIC
ncbi:MAG: hypothetical protein C0504_09630 [Candidatus Solibacter sp.]|nr:hypothetical protein [Candidatus Solibacter sp.]